MAKNTDRNYIHIMLWFIAEMVMVFFGRLTAFTTWQRDWSRQITARNSLIDKVSSQHLISDAVLSFVLCAPCRLFLSAMFCFSVFCNAGAAALLALRNTTIYFLFVFVEFGQWQQLTGTGTVWICTEFVGSCSTRWSDIIRHVVSPPKTTAKPRIVTSNRSALSIGLTGVNCITKRRIIQVCNVP